MGACRYPGLTFDEFATVFFCPSCRNFCNCTHCARARGEEYVPERNGGWRKWGAFPSAAAAADAAAVGAAGPTLPLPPSQRRRRKSHQEVVASVHQGRGGSAGAVSTTTETTEGSPVPVLDKWNTAVFTVTGELMGEVFSDGNKTRIVPAQPAGPSPTTLISTFRLSPPASAAATALATVIDATPSLPPAKSKKRRYVYIGKRLKAWGRLVSVPDPEEQLQKGKTQRGVGRGRGRRGRSVRVRLFAGSEEPLLLARKRRKRKDRRNSSVPLQPSSPVRIPNSDENVDADADVDEGVWPGEVRPSVPAVETAVENKEDHLGSVWITPQELERAISAAFAVGLQ